MSGVAEIGAAMLGVSQRRLEVVSQNIANVHTPGFQATESVFPPLSSSHQLLNNIFHQDVTREFLELSSSEREGDLTVTGRDLDLAISGEGYFRVRHNESGTVTHLRDGHFMRDSNGFVTDGSGRFLQNVEGRNLRINAPDVTISTDGTVFENDRPVDRVAIFSQRLHQDKTIDASFELLASGDGFQVRQGMIEASNVVMADQMITMMEAVRQAEIGSRVLQTYDTLMGQALSTFARS